LDISTNKLEKEGELYKIKDVHTDHEAILYLNSRYALEKVIYDPPAPVVDEPIVKGLAITEEEEEEITPEAFSGANRIYKPTKDPHRIPVHDINKLIVLNMDGTNTLADIHAELKPEWPDLTPEYLLRLIHQLRIRGWIQEVER